MRADAAAQRNTVAFLLRGIWRDAVIWTIPALVAVLICAVLGLHGPLSLSVSMPAVGITILGSCVYVPMVYVAAMKRYQGVR